MLSKVENGNLTIDVHELLAGLFVEEKQVLAEALAISDDVIERVGQQIVTGWTEAGSHGFNDSDAADPTYPLGKAIRAVALGSGGVAARQVEDLSSTMRRQHAYHDQMQRWAWTMYHAMQDARRDGRACPCPPECPSAYDATGDAFIVVANAGVRGGAAAPYPAAGGSEVNP